MATGTAVLDWPRLARLFSYVDAGAGGEPRLPGPLPELLGPRVVLLEQEPSAVLDQADVPSARLGHLGAAVGPQVDGGELHDGCIGVGALKPEQRLQVIGRRPDYLARLAGVAGAVPVTQVRLQRRPQPPSVPGRLFGRARVGRDGPQGRQHLVERLEPGNQVEPM